MAQLASVRPAPVAFAPEPCDPPPAAMRQPRSAGWFPDPEHRATVRFFDGDGWTEHTRGPAPLRTIASNTKPAAVETRCFTSFENRRATVSVVLGAASLVLNPLFVTTAIALITGVSGLRRSRSSLSRQGRARSSAGIVLALLGVMTSAVLTAVAIPVFLHLQDTARGAAVQTAISRDAAAHGVQLAALHCPAPAPDPGAGMTCAATTAGHDRVRIEVRLSADGSRVQVAEHPVALPRHR